MKESLLSSIRCPDCRGELKINNAEKINNEYFKGELGCNECTAVFPISDNGVPQLLPTSLTSANPTDDDFRRKKIEMKTRDEQAKVYDNLFGLKILSPFEIPMVMKRADVYSSDVVLEGGSGTGRFTQVLSPKAKEVFAVDISLESLHLNKEKVTGLGVDNTHWIQADLSHLPLTDNLFDKVISCQVIEHLPSASTRAKAINEFGRTSKSGSKIVVSGYKYNLAERFFGKKEGEHTGNIPFFRFTKNEFIDLMEQSLKVSSISGSLIYLWLAECYNEKEIIST